MDSKLHTDMAASHSIPPSGWDKMAVWLGMVMGMGLGLVIRMDGVIW